MAQFDRLRSRNPICRQIAGDPRRAVDRSIQMKYIAKLGISVGSASGSQLREPSCDRSSWSEPSCSASISLWMAWSRHVVAGSNTVATAPFATQIAISCTRQTDGGDGARLFHGDRRDGAADVRVEPAEPGAEPLTYRIRIGGRALCCLVCLQLLLLLPQAIRAVTDYSQQISRTREPVRPAERRAVALRWHWPSR